MAAEVADTSPALRDELQKAFAHLQGRLEKGLAHHTTLVMKFVEHNSPGSFPRFF